MDTNGLWALLIAVATVVISNAVVFWILIKLPATFFCEPPTPPSQGNRRHVALHWVMVIGRNLVGVILTLLGVLLSLPGVPGPGLLLIAIGIMWVDFPGKHRLGRKLVGRPGVLRAINRLRDRFGHPPLVLQGEPAQPNTRDGVRK